MIKIILFFIFSLLIYLTLNIKKNQNKEFFSNSCTDVGTTIVKNLGGCPIADCKIQKGCKTNKCPDNMEQINNGPCVKKCSDKEYRNKIDGICKLKPCAIKGKQRDKEGNCFWPQCSDIRKERDQISGECKWKSCDNEFRQRDEKTGKCIDIPCSGVNPSEQIRNQDGNCEYKSCPYPNIQERINGICTWKQCDDEKKRRDNIGNCIYKDCENSEQQRNANGDCHWKPCPNNKKERNDNGHCIWKPCKKSGMIQDDQNGNCSWTPCSKSGMILDDENGNCSWPKCPKSNQKNIDGNCVDIIDCELGETVYSECEQDNTRSMGQRVKINSQNGGVECPKPRGTIKGETVYNFKKNVDCGLCSLNQVRKNGICLDIVDCELDETIYSECQKNNTRTSGQPIKTVPQNGGKKCEKPGRINGQIVYNFLEGAQCAPCDTNKIRIDGKCEDILDCELGETVYSNCDVNNKRKQGQLVKRAPKNGGKECERPGKINGQNVYNFKENIECAACEANQKRKKGLCVNVVDCELDQAIYSDCKETNIRFSGQPAKTIGQNGGLECQLPKGEINGKTVYNFKEVPCQPCGPNKVRDRGVCRTLHDWKLFYKSVNGNVQKNESRDNSKNSAIIAVIDSKMLKDVSNGNKERMDIWALGGGHGQPGLRYESRGYFMPKCKTDSRNIIAVFGSGTGNGLQYRDFRRQDKWGDNDIIYIHSGYNGVSHIMTADKNGKIHYNRRNITSNDCPKQFNMTSNPNLTKFIKQFYIFQTNDENKVFTYNDIPDSAKV